jgi:glyoxylase-like metal-dependent hydrolase (beta-lactamase superfamily II)/8-oxo-dGTP pyrophosphatase MutT (NUDIX family)
MSSIIKPPTIIKAASIILQRTDGTILLCQRSHKVSFFPTFWAFPGGKIEDPLDDKWNGDEIEAIQTVLEEMFQEVGIIPGRREGIQPNQRTGSYMDFDYDSQILLEFRNEMNFIGRKKTPPFRIKLYDTAYFHIKHIMIDDFDPVVDQGELVDFMWILPEEAVKRWENQKLKLPPPTIHLLKTLAQDPENLQVRTLVETELPIGLQTRVEFAPGFELIPFQSRTIPPFTHTNLTVIRSEESCMIIDPGANEHEKEHFIEVIASLPSTPVVVLTHHHDDHWNGLKYVEELYPDATLYAHPKTITRIRTSLQTKEIETGILNIGSLEIEIKYTPGHTDSHIMLFENKTGVLIAGDHVVGYGSAVLSEETGDMQQYFQTTRDLIELKPRIIFPSHGPPNFNPVKLLNQYIQHRQEREDAIFDAIKTGNKTLDTIVETVYQDVPEQMWEFAKSNIKLHIKKLKNEGKVAGKFL